MAKRDEDKNAERKQVEALLRKKGMTAEQVVELLRRMGGKAELPKKPLVRKTFVLPEELAEAVVTEARARKLKVQEAAKQAFEDWLKKPSKK